MYRPTVVWKSSQVHLAIQLLVFNKSSVLGVLVSSRRHRLTVDTVAWLLLLYTDGH